MGRRSDRSELWVLLPDLHHPEVCWPAFWAVVEFMKRNPVAGVVLLGDNMNCDNISRHNKGKPRLKTRGGLQRDLDTFDSEVLQLIEKAVGRKTERIWVMGNHEDWLEQWLDENPEFEGVVSFEKALRLAERGWKIVPQGEFYRIGKAYILHGDQIGSGQYVAKKLVESYCATAVMGHVHTASMMTKVSQVKAEDKWIGYTLPTLGTLAPKYAKGAPNAFLNGFGIVELWPNGFVNVYIPVIFGGRFSFAGVLYG